MAKNETVRLPQESRQADEEAFLALKAIAGYSPNPHKLAYRHNHL